MKLGVQLYSVRQFAQNYEDLSLTFDKLKKMGYDCVQLSCIGAEITPLQIAELSKAYSLPVPTTHSPVKRIVEDTDALIAEHKLYGATEIGIGKIAFKEFETIDKARAVFDMLKEPAKKISDAGLSLAYHNHADEFNDIGGVCFLDLAIEEFKELHFILDTYWTVYAGHDPIEYVKRIGGARMENLHFKDMATEGKGKICACGNGILDFASIYDAAKTAGVKNVYVEQDNAQEEYGDAFEQMQISYDHLKSLFGKQ